MALELFRVLPRWALEQLRPETPFGLVDFRPQPFYPVILFQLDQENLVLALLSPAWLTPFGFELALYPLSFLHKKITALAVNDCVVKGRQLLFSSYWIFFDILIKIPRPI